MPRAATQAGPPPRLAEAPPNERAVRAENPAPAGLDSIPASPIPAVNVASVPQRSPLRYPGGKTWLIPHLRHWLSGRAGTPCLVEPFCGGGIISLTAVMEGLADRCVLVELDRDVAAFWHTALRHTEALCQRVLAFEPTRDNVLDLANRTPADLVGHGFRTLVLNRTAAAASLPRVRRSRESARTAGAWRRAGIPRPSRSACGRSRCTRPVSRYPPRQVKSPIGLDSHHATSRAQARL